MQPVSFSPAEGIRCLCLQDSRFKTARITTALLLPLREETAAGYAILPFLLRRSCAAYPDFTALNRRLNELYGARVTTDVSRVGEAQALLLTVSCIDNRFALAQEDVAGECAALLGSMLFEPALENGCFRETDVEQEKRCLKERIEAEIDEKRWYARHRAEQVMCAGEPYAVNRYGRAEDVEKLTPDVVTALWRQALAEACVQVVIQGGEDGRAVAEAIGSRFGSVPGRHPARVKIQRADARQEPENLTESMPVNQSKLVLGFRAESAEPDGDVAAMRLLNSLWGGTPHSLLFRNVREKLSLCYYCASSYDRLKGVMLVDSGVQLDKADQAREEILRQLAAVQQGDFTDEDLEAARRSLINQLESVGDLQSTLSNWYLGQAGLEKIITPQAAAEAAAQVTRERVQKAAAGIRLDAIYMLAAQEAQKKEGEDE